MGAEALFCFTETGKKYLRYYADNRLLLAL